MSSNSQSERDGVREKEQETFLDSHNADSDIGLTAYYKYTVEGMKA